MQRGRSVIGLGLVTSISLVLSMAGVAFLSVCAALTILIFIPAFVATRYVESKNGADPLDEAAYAYGGIGITCWCLWVASLYGGGRVEAIAVTVLFVAVVLVVMAPADLRRKLTFRNSFNPSVSAETLTVLMTGFLMTLLVALPFLPYGWHAGDVVHRMSMTDWYKHLSVATTLQHANFPPSNPFLMAVDPSPYYYGFHLVASSFQRFSDNAGDLFFVLLGLTLVTAAAFPVVVYTLARGLFCSRRCAAVAAVAASLLAGFDLIVWVLYAFRDVVEAWPLDSGMAGLRALVPSSQLDFWIHHNERQFSPPYVSTIWAPQHVAAVLTALLVMHMNRPQDNVVIGRLGFLPMLLLASLPAMSAYVAVSFVVGITVSVLLDAERNRCAPWRTDAFRRWARVGFGAAVLAVPVLWVLVDGSSNDQLTLGLSAAGGLLNGAVFSTVFGDGSVSRLLDTPVLYLVEFGVVGVFGLSAIRRRVRQHELSSAQQQAIVMMVAITVFVTFVRPSLDGPNNLFARPMLLVWVLLACFAADEWCYTTRRRLSMTTGVFVCAMGTVLAVAGATAEGFLFRVSSTEAVEVSRWINANTPDSSVVAFRPPDRSMGYWLRRRVVAADRRHALLFGASAKQYDEVTRQLDAAYNTLDPEEAWIRFRDVGADVIVVAVPTPRWARAPCFLAGYRGATFAVLTRAGEACSVDSQP